MDSSARESAELPDGVPADFPFKLLKHLYLRPGHAPRLGIRCRRSGPSGNRLVAQREIGWHLSSRTGKCTSTGVPWVVGGSDLARPGPGGKFKPRTSQSVVESAWCLTLRRRGLARAMS